MRIACDIEIRRANGFRLDCRLDVECDALGIVGPSGSGKSTLLAAIAGIECASRLEVDGLALTRVPVHRRRLGYVTQDAALFPHLNIRRNLAYAPRARISSSIGLDAVAAALHIEHLLERMPRNLSGGERRRVALARAIAANPRVLLLDEPFAGLDEPLRREAMSLLQHVRQQLKIPVILVSHQPEEVVGLTDWAVRLQGGSIAACGPTATVLRANETQIDNYLVGELIDGHFVVEGVKLSVAFPALQPPPLRAASAQTGLDTRGIVRAACYARDIVLARRKPEEISARNIIPVTILESTPIGDAVLLAVSPPRMLVIVTPAAAASLNLAPGRQAYAIIKATSIAYLGQA